MLRIQLLGGLSIQNERQITGAAGQRKARLLLAMIAAAPTGGITREKLLGYFWPDAPEERAQNSLRQQIFSLRRDLGEDELFVGSSELRLNPSAVLIDLWEFERAVADRDHARAAAAYAGPFLDGIFLKNAPEVERWIEDRRAILAAIATSELTAVATTAGERGEHERAMAAWRRLVAIDPTAAASAAGMIRALANAGDTRAALSHYRVYGALLRDEFSIEPDPRVAAVVDAIRSEQSERRATSSTSSTRASSDVDANASVDAFSTGAASGVAHATDLVADVAAEPSPGPARGRHLTSTRRRVILAGGVLVTAVFALVLIRQSFRAVKLDQKRVLVTQFRNETGNTNSDALGSAAASAIATELSRNGIADVIDSRTAIGSPSVNTSPESPRDAARRVGAGTIVSGAFVLRNDSIFVDAAVTDVQSGVVRQAVQSMGMPRDSASLLVARLRGKVAGALAAMQDTLFMQVAGSFIEPPNLDAYREFTAGLVKLSRSDWQNALKHFHEALRLDSTFVLAALWAAHEAAGDDDFERLVQFVTLHRVRLAELDQAHLDYLVAWRKRDLQAAFDATDRMLKSAPKSFTAIQAHGKVALEMRRFDEAARTYARVDLSGHWPDNWVNYYQWATNALHHVHDYRKELEVWQTAARRHPLDPGLCTGQLRALAALNRLHDIAQVVERCAALEPNGVALGRLNAYRGLAKELHAHSHRTMADSVWSAAVVLAEALAAANPSFGAFLEQIYYEAGRYEAAAPTLIRSVMDNPAPRPFQLGMAAVSAARSGDTATARALRSRLEALPTARPQLVALSWLNMAEGKHDAAIRNLQEFDSMGGLVVQQLYANRLFEPIWHRSEWKALFRPR